MNRHTGRRKKNIAVAALADVMNNHAPSSAHPVFSGLAAVLFSLLLLRILL
jgi:hypothetical protein